jgi:uncharacterized membrane protein (UPF0182 family)
MIVTAHMSLWRTPRTRALLLVGTIGVCTGLVALVARVYTDYLWFREVGQDRAYWTMLTWKVLTPAVAGLGTTCFLLANLAIVVRRTASAQPPSARWPAMLWRRRRIAFPLVAIACGLITVERLPDEAWRLVLLWANGGGFGAEDPLFHRDAGFFVFSLPLYELVSSWLLVTVLMAGTATTAAYAVVRPRRPARAHLLALGALALAVMAWRVRLDQFSLALPHEGSMVPGASYTDVHVRLPALRILALLWLGAAGVCAIGAVRRISLRPLIALGILGVVATAAAGGAASLVERVSVAPQALARERPYVADAITATRRAFALDAIDVRHLSGDGTVSTAAVTAHRRTLENVPVWDPGVLRPAMNELQTIGGYYGFPSTTIDRYTVGGRPRLMTVAARQLDLSRLEADNRSWANTHFAYTHGYGMVGVRGGEADADGYPRFAQREFRSPRNPLRLSEPRIYYGERAGSEPRYVVVDSGRGEVEQPAPGSLPPAYHYGGAGGIAVAGLLRRAAFAARLGDLQLLLTSTVTSRSRIILHRDVRDRLLTLAPFLRWDAHAQVVVAGGRVQFLFHGYTTSSSYPYSAPVDLGQGRVNYVRGSALAVVDAYSGHVSIYADPEDPILRAWRAAFPQLFLPLADLPEPLREHLRYPRQLFDAQADAYLTYHASDVTGFWNGSDVWQQSRELAGPVEDAGEIHFPDTRASIAADERSARPSYLLVRLPGDRRERFVLASSFTPRGRQNLVGYLAGSVDSGGAPRLTLLSLPRDRLTIGPTQATRAVLANPGVSSRIQLLNRESRDLGRNSVNRTVLGTPRVIPVGDALVHVQPVYVTSGGNGLPRLQLVTAYANGRVGYGRDVQAALGRAVRGAAVVAPRRVRAAGGARP